jgi:hypothetical protein
VLHLSSKTSGFPCLPCSSPLPSHSHSAKHSEKNRDDHRSAPAGHSIRQWPPPPAPCPPPSPSSSSYPSPPPPTPTTRYSTTCPPSPTLAPSKRAHYMRSENKNPLGVVPPSGSGWLSSRATLRAPLDPRSLGARSAWRRPGPAGSLCSVRRIELSGGC